MTGQIVPSWPPSIATRTGWQRVDHLAAQLQVDPVWIGANAARMSERAGLWIGPRAAAVLRRAAAQQEPQ